MKRFFLLVITTLFILIALAPATAGTGESLTASDWSNSLNWVSLNWATIALIISEIAAFLPPKFNGIVQTAVSLVSAILKKKKVKS